MILAIVDHDRGMLDELSLQAITFAASLAPGEPVHALVVGATGADVAAALGKYGVAEVHLAAAAGLTDYSAAAVARSAAELVERLAPDAVVAAGSLRGNETLAHLGAMTDLPVAIDCSQAQLGSPTRVTRARWAGNLIEQAELDGRPALLSVLAHSVAAALPGSGAASVNKFEPALTATDLATQVMTRVSEGHGGASLVNAKVIISGGRGVGGPEGFGPLDELAALLGGAVGCSRVVTSAGWRPHAEQVGQTGTKVAPDLYLACGISGATQHLAGCRNSKTIVVINTDADAPIMANADYAIIGDLHKILPAVVVATRAARA
jgi:electron transfer flavoprotein alpha subunit